MAITPHSFPAFDMESEPHSIGPRWTKWVQRFDNYVTAMNISGDARLKALLLHLAGEKVHDIYDTLAEAADKYADTKTKLTNYFAPKKNVQYEVYVFRNATQQPGENLDTFNTRLQMLAKNCEFTDVNREIKAQIVQTCTSSRLRRHALREPDLSLQDLLEHGRTLEISEQQASGIENSSKTPETVNAISHKHFKNQPKHYVDESTRPTTKCRNCGGLFPHKTVCPAKGRICNACGKPNHFSKVCRSSNKMKRHTTQKFKRTIPNIQHNEVHHVIADVQQASPGSSSSDDAYVFVVKTANTAKLPQTHIELCDTNISALIDSGAAVNILSETTYKSLVQPPELRPSNIQIFSYGSKQALPILGTFTCTLKSRSDITRGTFYVIPGNGCSLLSYQTAEELNLIRILNSLNTTVIGRSIADELVEKHPELFQGIGKLKDFQVKLHINPDIQPTCQPHRRVPFHIRKKVEAELKTLEDSDIIETITGPTPWVSPIVAPPKPKDPDKVRICVDMRQANVAIVRERHLTPTMDDIIHELNGATVFSKLDLKAGYHQLELHPDSRYITTFSTHLGLRRYKRLNFGISSAAEVFQNAIRQTLQGIRGVMNFSDDIIVFGSTQADHDSSLTTLFQRLKEKGLTLNRSKCEFNKSKLEFFGFVFSANGISADPKKVLAVQHASAPTCVTEMRSLLGMANYCSRFIPDFATVTEPLRKLTRKGTTWEWGTEQESAFNHLKELLTSNTVMAYFDPKKNTELIVDASPVGLGAILLQNQNGQQSIIAYASKALTDVERRYSQTEREALAIVWSCEHFHLYIYGNPFTLITDHKPLELIWNNPCSKPPARIERWGLRLQPYDFTVKYKKGSDNPADYMSRHPVSTPAPCNTRAAKVAEEYINFLAQHSTPKAMTIDQIKQETLNSPVLQKVCSLIRTNSWGSITDTMENASTLLKYKRIHSELTTLPNDDLILRFSRIVIPPSLEQQVLQLAHESHQGIVKTKTLLREKVWFPDMDTKAEAMVANCLACQANTPAVHPEPLQMSKLPEDAWQEVSADFYGPLQTGEYMLVIIDDYSRYPVVEVLHSINGNAVIPVMDKIFSMFGIPKIVKTDNGPPFNSDRFSKFAEYLGFHHRKITPFWPQANGSAERFMQTLGKALRIAGTIQIPWRQQLCLFLREYRATPHSTTNTSPAELMFRRKLRTKIPNIATETPVVSDHDLRKRDGVAKAKMKAYADSRRHASSHTLQIGDQVLHRQPKQHKLTAPYNTVPHTVTRTKGSMITAVRGSHSITRNSSFFKRFVPPQNAVPCERGNDLPKVVTSTRYPIRRNRQSPAYLSDYSLK